LFIVHRSYFIVIPMRRILVIRSGALGDFVLTLPAIRALREAAPRAHVEVVGRTATLEIARGRYYADAIRSIDRADFAPLFAPEGEASPEVVAYLTGFDLILSYLPDRDEVFRQNLERIGVRRLACGDPVPAPDEVRHIVDRLAEPVEAAGIPVKDRTPRVFPNEEDGKEAEAFLKGRGISESDPFVVIHPGSGGARKCWPAERFARVADEVRRTTGARVVVPQGPADEQVVAQMVSEMAVAPVVARGLPLPVLAGALARCRAYLGNDSGVTHLGAASGAPVVALFGPTDPRVWGPRGGRVRVVQGDAKLPPEQRLEAIREEEVIRAVREIANCKM
jgi:heptosyltransferase-2